jgi:hypothetical protein
MRALLVDPGDRPSGRKVFYMHRREPLVFQEKSKHNDGDALWERGYDRRQNVRRAGRNIYARSDVDSPTAPRAIFSRRSTAVCWWRERTRQRQPT